MIADLCFGPPAADGIRPARFIPRSSIPLSAACLVANGLRETLRELFGERCELAIGEPASIGAAAWDVLSRQAYCFLTSGRQTDIVLVLPEAHARTLVLRAFGEAQPDDSTALSALELQAVERIAARCAAAFDPLCAERRGGSQRVAAAVLPACVAYFDVRVAAPVSFEFGVGIVRELPDPGPANAFPPGLLANVPVDVSVEFGAGTIDIATLLRLEPGDVVPLDTKVGAAASLKVGHRRFATGSGGVRTGRYCFEVQSAAYATGARG
jgi:flagellar motor switch/type III secretory pathway protein FliN